MLKFRHTVVGGVRQGVRYTDTESTAMNLA